MSSGRRRTALAVAVLAALLLVVWLLLRPTHDARDLLALLPPEADAYLVIDLERLQSNPALRKLLADPPAAARAPEYDAFLRQSGFHYQEDLRLLAAAKLGADWVGAAVVELDRERWSRYAASQGATQSSLGAHTAYRFGSERPIRFVLLEDNLVAFAIGRAEHGFEETIARYSEAALSSAKTDLEQRGLWNRGLEGAGVWFAGRTERLLAANGSGPGVASFLLGRDWWAGSRLVLGRVVSSPLRLDIQIENQCESAVAAERMAGAFKTLLALLRSAPGRNAGGAKYAPLLETVEIRQQGDSVLFDWQWDSRMLALLAEDGP
ncbi:MAG TPA: hypothetical protein VNN17_00080 [Terriglobia bacterium]|nr:hypothetical protein [Terriglobia bacterium]